MVKRLGYRLWRLISFTLAGTPRFGLQLGPDGMKHHWFLPAVSPDPNSASSTWLPLRGIWQARPSCSFGEAHSRGLLKASGST